MAKPEWGTKRTCDKCGARFYDLNRSPAVCPQCGTPWTPKHVLRRAGEPPAKAVPTIEPEVEGAPEEEVELEIEEGVEKEAEEEEVEEEAEEPKKAADDGAQDEIIEDTADLGEDDVAGVIENVDEPGKAKE